MRVSEFYQLDRTQPTLDFVDIDIRKDVKLFVDPRAVRLLPSAWGAECVSLIQNFFETVLVAIRQGDNGLARRLLASLQEPNETHLGLSRGRSRGSAVGSKIARRIWRALSRSEAVQSGLLSDLEDTVLMIENIDADRVSDIATNIVRQPLIRYTQDVCKVYGIPMESDISSGPLWDPRGNRSRAGIGLS